MYHAHRDADTQIDFSTFSQSLPTPPSPHRITPIYVIHMRLILYTYVYTCTVILTDRQTDKQTDTCIHTQHTYTQHTHMHTPTYTHNINTHNVNTHNTYTADCRQYN